MSRNKLKNTFILVSLLLISISRVVGQCHFNQADKFDNIWVVNNGEVICFDKQSQKIGTYSNILLGNPSYVDVLDPFRVIVFYPSSHSITILNNTVAEISKPIMLREKGINDASLVCRSGKGGFWVLDRTNWEIVHFDAGFNPTGEKFIPDMTFSGSKPLYMQEDKGILYLAFEEKGICRFDTYGARMGDIPVKVNSFFTFIDGKLVYQFEGKIFQYNLENNQITAFNLSFQCIPVKVQGIFLYFDGRGLAVYKI